jgi:hypothetical protein
MKTNVVLAAVAALAGLRAHAAVVTIEEPAMDKWMYGNVSGSYSGTRETAPVFGFPNTAGDEDRLGQLLVAFLTSSDIPTGLGASKYNITRVTMSVFNADNYTNTLDTTPDSFRTYLDPLDSLYLPDADAGRPVELFGVGLRNGYTRLSPTVAGAGVGDYHERSPLGASATAIHGRHAYPLGYMAGGSPVDVSDNVSERFEAEPWAVAKINGLSSGALIPEGSEYRFELNLTSPYILAYLQQALNDGVLGLTVAPLHPASGQSSATPYPTLFTRENQLGPEYAPRLEVEYTIIPEPTASSFAVIGLSILALGRGWRRRSNFD